MEEKNYIIAETKAPIKIGDYLVRKVDKEYSFGRFKLTEKVLLTPENIEKYLSEGILKVVGEQEETHKEENLLPYIKRIGENVDLNPEEVTALLDKLNKFSPYAVLSMLLEAVSDVFYEKKDLQDGIYFTFDPSTGNIITYPGIVDPCCEAPALFANMADAARAKEILCKQFDYMYGK